MLPEHCVSVSLGSDVGFQKNVAPTPSFQFESKQNESLAQVNEAIRQRRDRVLASYNKHAAEVQVLNVSAESK